MLKSAAVFRIYRNYFSVNGGLQLALMVVWSEIFLCIKNIHHFPLSKNKFLHISSLWKWFKSYNYNKITSGETKKTTISVPRNNCSEQGTSVTNTIISSKECSKGTVRVFINRHFLVSKENVHLWQILSDRPTLAEQ